MIRDDDESGFPWLESALVVSGLALFFQLLPGVWSSVLGLAALDKITRRQVWMMPLPVRLLPRIALNLGNSVLNW